MSNRVTITINHQQYELVRGDEGENACSKCALVLMCWDLRGGEDPPCLEFTSDPQYYWRKIESLTDKNVTIWKH